MEATNDPALWETRHAQINTIVHPLVAGSEALRSRSATSPIWKSNDAFIQTSTSYSGAVLVYLAGFEAIYQDTPGINTSDELRAWVKKVDRNRSAMTIASMNASAICSTLEGFLRAIVADWADQTVVDRIRAEYQRPTRSGSTETLSNRLAAAHKQLDTWLKPSGGAAFNGWLKVVRCTFQCSFPQLAETIVDDLIRFRHTITHPQELPTAGKINSPHAARISCWGLATIALTTTITHSVARASIGT